MDSINLGDMQDRLSELVDGLEAGETIDIMQNGQPVARIVKTVPLPPRKPIDVARLRALTAGMTPQTESAGDFMRRLRDSDRY